VRLLEHDAFQIEQWRSSGDVESSLARTETLPHCSCAAHVCKENEKIRSFLLLAVCQRNDTCTLSGTPSA